MVDRDSGNARHCVGNLCESRCWHRVERTTINQLLNGSNDQGMCIMKNKFVIVTISTKNKQSEISFL